MTQCAFIRLLLLSAMFFYLGFLCELHPDAAIYDDVIQNKVHIIIMRMRAIDIYTAYAQIA